MTQALLEGNRIEIRCFGSFNLNYRPPRVGRNPRSGEKVHVPEKYMPHFKGARNCGIGLKGLAPRSHRIFDRRAVAAQHRFGSAAGDRDDLETAGTELNSLRTRTQDKEVSRRGFTTACQNGVVRPPSDA